MKHLKFLFITFCVVLYACQAPQKKPAVLTLTDADEVQNLQRSIRDLLNNEQIQITELAFKFNNILILERNRRLDRDYSTPQHLQLWIQGQNCFLEYVETGEIKSLEGLACVVYQPTLKPYPF